MTPTEREQAIIEAFIRKYFDDDDVLFIVDNDWNNQFKGFTQSAEYKSIPTATPEQSDVDFRIHEAFENGVIVGQARCPNYKCPDRNTGMCVNCQYEPEPITDDQFKAELLRRWDAIRESHPNFMKGANWIKEQLLKEKP